MITTHILDVSKGGPASGVPVRLEYFVDSSSWRELGRDVTNVDGRASNLLSPNANIQEGTYRLTFDTASYFAAQNVDGFYPHVTVAFIVNDAKQHYHVPLLLSPFGFTTYRGS